MKLLSLSMRNFMPYKGEQRVDFPTDSRQNVMVVFGDNMRGKTSLLNAIRWGFYGYAMGRHLRLIPVHKLHNWEAAIAEDWQMEVRILFAAEGHEYDLIRRAIKKKHVAQPARPEDFEVDVHLKRDGAALPSYSIPAEINKFAPEQVSRFFLFDGELLQEYETLLIEGSEQGRQIKDEIEQVLGVPALIHGRDVSATLLKKAQKEQTKDLMHQQGAEKVAQRQEENQRKSDSLEKDIGQLKERLKAIKDNRSNLDDELEKTESIYKAKASLTEHERRLSQNQKDQEQLTAQRLDLISKAWKDLIRPKLRLRLAQLESDKARYLNEVGNKFLLEQNIKALSAIIHSSVCETCGQEVTDNHRKKAGHKLGECQAKLETYSIQQDALANISSEIAKISELLSENIGSQLRDKDTQLNRLSVEQTQIENAIEKLEEELEGHDTAEMASMRSRRDAYLKQEGQIEADILKSQATLDDVKKELAISAIHLATLSKGRAIRSNALVNAYSALERAFSDSIDKLRESLKNSVEEKASSAFKELTTQKDYSGLCINENYGLTILDERGQPITIRSAGAEQIVALSLIDGLSRTGRSAGPVIMDTPFGRLDSKHRGNILRYLPNSTSQLILLVHDGEIRPETDLAPIMNRIGAKYIIRNVGARHSQIERSLT